MLNLIIDELNEAMSYLWEDDWGYAYHAGKAGGIAAAVGAVGFVFDSLCDEISNAYELLDLAAEESDDFDDFDPEEFEEVSDYIVDREGYYWVMISQLKDVTEDDAAYDLAAASCIGWKEYGIALNEAVKAKTDGNELRYALMIGFVSRANVSRSWSAASRREYFGRDYRRLPAEQGRAGALGTGAPSSWPPAQRSQSIYEQERVRPILEKEAHDDALGTELWSARGPHQGRKGSSSHPDEDQPCSPPTVTAGWLRRGVVGLGRIMPRALPRIAFFGTLRGRPHTTMAGCSSAISHQWWLRLDRWPTASTTTLVSSYLPGCTNERKS